MTSGLLREMIPMPPDLAGRRGAWHKAAATADADPADDFALNAACAAAGLLAGALGHGVHGGWQHDTRIGLVCECGAQLDPPKARVA